MKEPTARCKTCGRPIYWVKTMKNHANLPVDPTPTADGNVRLMTERGVPTLAEVIGNEKHWMKDEARYTSHWATCPTANQHRKER